MKWTEKQGKAEKNVLLVPYLTKILFVKVIHRLALYYPQVKAQAERLEPGKLTVCLLRS